MKLVGRFVVQKRDRNKNLIQEFKFSNIVLDLGWDSFASRWPGYFGDLPPKYLFLGTGTSEPAATDSGLESVSSTLAGLLRSAASYSGEDDPNGSWEYTSITQTFEYGEGEAEGTWTELGLAYNQDYTEPYNRSLFRDENGNAISIEVLSDEFLTVFVETGLYLYYPADITVDYNGSPITFSSDFHYIWYNTTTGKYFLWPSGFPAKAVTAIDPVKGGYAFSQSMTRDVANMTATADIVIDPGTEDVTFDKIEISNQEYGRLQLFADTQVVKPADEKMTFSISVTYSRA